MELPEYNYGPVYMYKCTVKRILDGDTFEGLVDYGFREYTDRSIRLHGVDAPETNAKTEAERIHAKAARDFVVSVLPIGCEVTLATAKMAIYDRIEAVVYYTDPQTGKQHSLGEALRANDLLKRSSYT